MIAQTAMQTFLEATAALHDHLCPRQVLGVRMGMLAGKLLGLALPQQDKRMLTLVESDGCFADGVAVSTGCWLGHRTMRLIDYGKIAATFVDTETDRAIRIAPSHASRSLAPRYAHAASDRWHAYLEGYQEMPDDELFSVQRVVLRTPAAELLSGPGFRVHCTACGEEIINQREVLIDGEPFCRACAGATYYNVQESPA